MPKLFMVGPYVIYFWSGEAGEPVHVHVSVKRPVPDATKIWLTADGGCLVANDDGQLSGRDLADIQQFVAANHAYICEQWAQRFGRVTFYR
jgi:hypothetical protein